MFNHEAFRRTTVPSQAQGRLLDRRHNYQGANGDRVFFPPYIHQITNAPLAIKKQNEAFSLTTHTLLWVLRIKSLSSGSSSLHA